METNKRIVLENCGDTSIVSLADALPNSLQGGLMAELRWTFIEMRERRSFVRTLVDDYVRDLHDFFIGRQDLDLGCYYELDDGTHSLIEPVQFNGNTGTKDQVTKQGSFKFAPYIWHEGDNRGKNDQSVERLYVNPAGIKHIKKIYIYAFIWRGAAFWHRTDAKLEISVGGKLCVLLDLEKEESKKRFCVTAEIMPTVGGGLQVKKLSTFHNNHSDCDAAYHWGFRWTSGRKS